MTKKQKLAEALLGYMTAALWSSYNPDNESEEYLDQNYSVQDITESTKKLMEKDVSKFINKNLDALEKSGLNWEQIGHDFWLTRHHHGAGFWDKSRCLTAKLGKELSDAAQKFKEFHLWVDNDEIIGS